MKAKLFAITTLLVTTMSTNAFAAINLNINGKKLNLDIPPQVVNGRTLVPVRTIFEELGATVEWNSEDKVITGIKGTNAVVLQIDNRTAAIINADNVDTGGKQVTLEVPATIINNKTFVPARFVAEAFNADVNWDESTQTINITNSATNNNIQSSTNNVALTDSTSIQKYLVQKYAKCETPVGTANFNFVVFENDMDTEPYDFSLWVEYDLSLFTDIEHSIKFTVEQKTQAKTLLKNHMKKIADDLIKNLPNKKINGCYICSWYRYPHIREGYESRTAYSWKNYNGNILTSYKDAKLTSFQWNTEHDDFFNN